MANYYGKGRTNRFRVKDYAAFEEAAKPFGTVLPWTDGTVVVQAGNDEGDFTHYDEDTDTESALGDILCDHLAEGEVAVMMSVGSQKLCYLAGWATAYHSSGETVEVNLNEIYAQAQEAFPDATITEAVS